jgi:integrase
MASVKKRPGRPDDDPRYDVRYRTPAGQVRTKTFTREKAARAFANTVETDKHRGNFVDPHAGRVTLETYATEWLRDRPNLRPRTRETYDAQLRLHIVPTLGPFELRKLTPSSIRRWHSELSKNLGPSMVAKCYRLVRTILSTAVADELIARNPCQLEHAGVERAAERPVATVAEVYAAADAIGPRYRCIILLAGFCGLRRGELLGLECRHLNLLHGTLRVEQQEQQLTDGTLIVTPPKTAAGVRTLTLPTFLVAELEQHLASYAAPGPAGRVFPGEKGGSLRNLTLHKHWKQARAAAGLPDTFRFHDLRHTANTLTAAAGASTAELMARMGHASHQAALRYQHATKDRDAALATALDGFVGRAVARASDPSERFVDGAAQGSGGA